MESVEASMEDLGLMEVHRLELVAELWEEELVEE